MEHTLLFSSRGSAVKTLEEVYCAQHRCTPASFRRRVFWSTLHRHALPFAPLLLLGNHFTADHDLIAACGRAQSLRQIREELEDHRYHPQNTGWLRRRLALRISTHRLRRLARDYLPGSGPSAAVCGGGRSLTIIECGGLTGPDSHRPARWRRDQQAIDARSLRSARQCKNLRLQGAANRSGVIRSSLE